MNPEQENVTRDNDMQNITQQSLEENQPDSTELPDLLAKNIELRGRLDTSEQELAQDSEEEFSSQETANAETVSSEEEVPSSETTDNTPQNSPSLSEERENTTITPQEEEDLQAEEKLQKMRLSAFGQMVIKSKNLEQSVDKKFRQKVAGFVGEHKEVIGALTGVGLTGKSLYDTTGSLNQLLNYDTSKDKLAPTGKAQNDWKSIVAATGSSILLIVLSAIRIYKTFSASDSSTGSKMAKSLPSLFKILALGSDMVTSILENTKGDTMATKSILNFSTPFKSLMGIIEKSIDFYEINKQLKKINSLKPNAQSKFGIIKKDLETKKRNLSINTLTSATQCIAELSYAVSYLKNPRSKTTFGTKLGMNITSGISNYTSIFTSRAVEEVFGPDNKHIALAEKEYATFEKLYTDPKLFIGEETTPASLASVEDKNRAFNAYKDFHKELKALGVSVKELSSANSKKEQKELITNAVGF